MASVSGSPRPLSLQGTDEDSPALLEAEERDYAAVPVVHPVCRQMSFFQPESNGAQWADPVECLLDLHEARLESQARKKGSG